MMGDNDGALNIYVVDCDTDPYVPYSGWKVVEHKRGGQVLWDPTKVRRYLSKNQLGNKYEEGNRLRKELERQTTFNANLLEHLLLYPELIPKEWEEDRVFFWGTLFGVFHHGLCIRCLYFDGSRWGHYYYYLNSGFGNNDPALVVVD